MHFPASPVRICTDLISLGEYHYKECVDWSGFFFGFCSYIDRYIGIVSIGHWKDVGTKGFVAFCNRKHLVICGFWIINYRSSNYCVGSGPGWTCTPEW